ncbi:MAG TPA: hypothetical protein DEA08_13675 [Planctomycetes bacterium]|nr:hypothetical protein [Planctomycetota bacterium]
MTWLRSWLAALLLLLVALAPAAWADDISDLLTRLRDAGAKVVEVQPNDPRLREGRVTVGVGGQGQVEVYLPSGPGGIRTPLKSPTERLSLSEFRRLVAEMRTAVRNATGIEVERIAIAGSSTGIPFTDPNGQVRTFDRKGPRTSDYDGALISEELFNKVASEKPRAVRGKNTGKRTAPDPLPSLRPAFDAVSESWGRHVAAMVYAGPAEFQKRMNLQGFQVGTNVMLEPGPEARYVLPTRAEVLGALLEAKTLAALQRGRPLSEAQQLVEQARAGNAEAERTVRAARKAAAETLAGLPGLNAVDKSTFVNEAQRLAPSQGFAGQRSGAEGPLVPWQGSEGALRDVFSEVRDLARERALERTAELSGSEGERLRARANAISEAALEVTRSNGLLLEYVPERNAVRISTGLLNEIERIGGNTPEGRAARNKALGLLFAHELGHAGGLVSERMADREAVRTVERAQRLGTVEGQRFPLAASDVKSTLGLFGGRSLRDALTTLRELPRYGTPGGRRAAMLDALAGRADALGRYRRADGTLEWSRLTRDKALQQGAGVAHFALALFLKELAVVLRTGDDARLGEFVDGLMTTDFFVNYGLFAAGARAADVAYGRYVRRLARKKFVNGVIRSNLVLAAGLAVPQAVRGQFELDTYLVDVAALGLSATAVKAGVEGVKGVWRLVRAGRGAVHLGRLASPVGWVYTAGETALVLIVGDHLANRFDAYLTKRELRDKIKQAESALNDLLGRLERGESVLPAHIQEALDRVERAYDDMRRLEMMPLDARVRAFRREINGASGQMLEAETSLRALEERFAENPNLRRNLEERFGSTEAYLERLREARSGEAEERIRSEAERFERDFPRDLERAYRGEAEPGQPPAPDSRLDLYDQETTWILKALDATTDPEARRHLALALERVRLGRAMDASVLAAGGNPASQPARSARPEEAFVGAADRVRGE